MANHPAAIQRAMINQKDHHRHPGAAFQKARKNQAIQIPKKDIQAGPLLSAVLSLLQPEKRKVMVRANLIQAGQPATVRSALKEIPTAIAVVASQAKEKVSNPAKNPTRAVQPIAAMIARFAAPYAGSITPLRGCGR